MDHNDDLYGRFAAHAESKIAVVRTPAGANGWLRLPRW